MNEQIHKIVPVELAPMAGYTNLPFRLMAEKYGADRVTTEMVSAKGLYYRDKKTAKLMATVPEETAAGVQIFGSDPKIIAEAVERYINPLDFDFVDFNAGCPAPKIVKNGDGSALLNDLPLLEQVVSAMVKVSDKPVRVKLRLGWDDANIVIDEAIRRVEDAGAAAAVIHGRTRAAFYSGKADWGAIARAKTLVEMPVVANGDIDSPAAAVRCLDVTHADGLMVGRAAVGRPFIFAQIKARLAGKAVPQPSAGDILNIAIDHVRLVDHCAGQVGPMVEMRKQLVAYTKGMPDSARLRQHIFSCQSAQDMVGCLTDYAAAEGIAIS
ncbi:MAG: tRNA dihydrouridine synthase DusB [Eubacteriaceae bacterium]|uniref:tRNA-dihydrouridine synthase n=1 Tax=Candidatus Pseudoramibacter fermentans TaxID=2594427 RepID=A0A6L5GQ27_9FIRM|nr:tRNA dihydrouridine synthase DusB [Candidatus Pseudoramibacter fermentans]RRF92898.1 MAG: tRNA dihydrouridine synthase DusB [Eubacteriaceae bacterium]